MKRPFHKGRLRRILSLRTAFLALLVLASPACFLGGGSSNGAGELAELAGRVQGTTYVAVYTFEYLTDAAPGVTTRMEIAQSPPVSVRKLETSTQGPEGDTITVTSWQVRNEEGNFACGEYPEAGVQCQANPIGRGTFGTDKLDGFFDRPRVPESFSSVQEATRQVRIQEEAATCFEAVPAPASPAPESPQPTASSYRYEFCYAEDGVLLQARRVALSEAGAEGEVEAVVEAVSVSRVVPPETLELPGPVVEPSDI